MPVFDMQLLGERLEPDVGLLDRVIERRYLRVRHDLILRFAFRRGSSQRSRLVDGRRPKPERCALRAAPSPRALGDGLPFPTPYYLLMAAAGALHLIRRKLRS